MAYHPLEPRMYTAALDGLVRCYDLQDEAAKASLSESIPGFFGGVKDAKKDHVKEKM